MSEILPCPFCGNDPMPDFCSSNDGPAYFFNCQAKDCPAWPSVSGDTEAEAIAAWNQRSAPAQHGGERAAYETILDYISPPAPASRAGQGAVAWVYATKNGLHRHLYFERQPDFTAPHWNESWTETPLYAHPSAAPVDDRPLNTSTVVNSETGFDDTQAPPQQPQNAALDEALGKSIAFCAFNASDPLAIRFEFASDDDRLAAANAVDEAFLLGINTARAALSASKEG